jgi:hypothetical protein
MRLPTYARGGVQRPAARWRAALHRRRLQLRGADRGRPGHLSRAAGPEGTAQPGDLKAPTRFYKAGIAFLAWLNGAQSHFITPGRFQSSREITHYAEVFRLADRARLLSRPDLAVERMTLLLRLHGVD